MKVSISVPDALFEAADRLAHRFGVSRSELYARAMAAFLERHQHEGVTAALDRVYGAPAEGSQLPGNLATAQETSVPPERW